MDGWRFGLVVGTAVGFGVLANVLLGVDTVIDELLTGIGLLEVAGFASLGAVYVAVGAGVG